MSRAFRSTVSDPYAELGVARDADDREIKAAYRRLAARWHPDRNRDPSAAERMARINEAYRAIESGQAAAASPPPPRDAAAGGASARAGARAQGASAGGGARSSGAAGAGGARSNGSGSTRATGATGAGRAGAGADPRAAGTTGAGAQQRAAGAAGAGGGAGAQQRGGGSAEAGQRHAGGTASGAGARPEETPDPPARQRRSWWERDWGRARWEAEGVRAPEALRHEVRLTLEQAAAGGTHAVVGSVADRCAVCAGIGRLVSRRSDCEPCRGEGRMRVADSRQWQNCSHCGGDGAARKRCETCDGRGDESAPRAYHYDVRLPPGLRDGQSVMLRGQGQRGADGASDLLVSIRLQPHPLFAFEPDGRLGCRVPVDLYRALGHGSVEVPLLDGGLAEVDLAQGPLQHLPGLGYPDRDGRRGVLVVRTEVVQPSLHSESQRRLLRLLAEDRRESGYAGSPELAQWQTAVDAWRMVHGASGAGRAEPAAEPGSGDTAGHARRRRPGATRREEAADA